MAGAAMSWARAHNASVNDTPPPFPPPKGAPKWDTEACTGLDGAVYVAWNYTAADADSITTFHVTTTVRSSGAVVSERQVLAPSTDLVVDGLSNDMEYVLVVKAQNPGGDGPPSSALMITPIAPVVPPPYLMTIEPGDGKAHVTWSWGLDAEGLTPAFMSFEARNEVGSTVTDHIPGGTYPDAAAGDIPLTNDQTWTVQLIQVSRSNDTGKLYLSAPSNAMDVHPEQPIPPYRPDILDAYATEGGVLVVKWAPEDQPTDPTGGGAGPLDIDNWRIRANTADGKGTSFQYETGNGTQREWRERKLTIGWWEITVQAHNAAGWSEDSRTALVKYDYAYSWPLIGGGTTYETLDHWYLTCKVDTKLTRTDKGKSVPIRVAIIGAGGGGRRATLTGAKGGDGGGGELVIIDLPIPNNTGDVVVKVPGGATENSAEDPPPSSVTEQGQTWTARSGKTATTKDNAAGYGPVAMPESWRVINTFAWNKPYSYTVGGSTSEGTPQYPNGYGPGQGGAGLKAAGQRAGNGEDGLIVFRWRKDGKPDPEPLNPALMVAPTRRRWWQRWR